LRQVLVGWVDPRDVGDVWGDGWLAEAVGFEGVGVIEDGLAVGSDQVVLAVVDAGC
jgi:hypothetical protein